MFTTGSKWFFGLGLVSLVLAAAYGWTTGGSGLGPLTVGYKGGVGDHLGYGLLLAIAMVAVFGAGTWQVILAIAISDIPRAIRLQRSMVLGLKSRPFIDAARMAHAPSWWILVRHVVPSTIAPMLVVASIYAADFDLDPIVVRDGWVRISGRRR